MMPSVAVIIPAHNAAEHIGSALASVEEAIAFFRARDEARASIAVEVIVVDDGSTDGTAEAVARAVEGRAGYTLVRRSERSNASCARNLGVAASTGDLLFFLDGDDRFHRNHVHACYRAMEDPDVEFVKTGVTLTDPVHPQWHDRIRNSLVINLCVRRRAHDLIGGFLDYNICKRNSYQFTQAIDVFAGIEDVFYNRLLERYARGVALPLETVEYRRIPGNSYDRQYLKFQYAPGDYEDVREPGFHLRVKVAYLLLEHHVSSIPDPAEGRPRPA